MVSKMVQVHIHLLAEHTSGQQRIQIPAVALAGLATLLVLLVGVVGVDGLDLRLLVGVLFTLLNVSITIFDCVTGVSGVGGSDISLIETLTIGNLPLLTSSARFSIDCSLIILVSPGTLSILAGGLSSCPVLSKLFNRSLYCILLRFACGC